MCSLDGLSPDEHAQVNRLVHLGEHLIVHRQHPDLAPLMLVDCWWWHRTDQTTVPDWAATLAEANAPGWAWCPQANPRLLDADPASIGALLDRFARAKAPQ